MASRDELADSVGGLWTMDPPIYSAPGAEQRARPSLERELALLIEPKRCRPTGLAALAGVSTAPARESLQQVARRPGRGILTMEVARHRSVAAASSELQRWKDGIVRCRTFQAELTQGTYTVEVQELRTRGPRLEVTLLVVSGAGGVYNVLSLEQAGSALVRVNSQWRTNLDGSQFDEPVSAAEVRAVAALMTRRISRLGTPATS